MTNKTFSKKGKYGSLQEHHLGKWVVRPLSKRIKKHGRESVEQGKVILKTIKELNESIEIIAQQIARKAGGSPDRL